MFIKHRRGFFLVIFLLILSFSLVGCQLTETPPEDPGHSEDQTGQADQVSQAEADLLKAEIASLEDKVSQLEKRPAYPEEADPLLLRALETASLLKNKDSQGLSSYVSQERGVRFTPYSYVNTEEDQVFYPEDLTDVFTDSTSYLWGYYDGKGDKILLDFSSYYQEFIYDENFLEADMIGMNTSIGSGNNFINLEEVYPDAAYVEFHFTGFDSQYMGMDWRSLTLVFDQTDDLALIGIIHGQWTI